MARRERTLVGFASGSADLIESFLQELQKIDPAARLCVVSEFAPPRGQWIPYMLGRTVEQNLARIRDELQDAEVAWSAMILQPRMPYWRMRLAAFRLRPTRVLCFNENLNHFALRPGSAPQILRHLAWRTRNFIRWETKPGGWLYTQVWRLFHPWAYRRPAAFLLARLALALAALRKRLAASAPAEAIEPGLPEGISIVVPSRNGRELLAALLPGLAREAAKIASEIIVVDNGSTDGTTGWLGLEWPEVRVIASERGLGFAAAANLGVREARYSHTCLLNNDMVVGEGFFPALRKAFDEVPGLFCSSAQIFFPEGKRREETGKTIWRARTAPEDFPLSCPPPVEGEDLTPVLYGSGGCSLYDTARLRALGGFGECFTPAYVEDLDLGYRAWLRGWPTVLAAQAKVVHHHRSTTSKLFTDNQIQQFVERNFLRFLARSVASAEVFRAQCRRMLWRLNLQASKMEPPAWALPSLAESFKLPLWVERAPRPVVDEKLLLALCSGDVANFPGARRESQRPALVVASPYLPFPLAHGGAVRMYNLMREAAREYDLVLVCFCDEHSRPADELLELCREIVLVRREGSHLRPLTDRPDVVEEHDQPAFRAALKEAIRRHKPFAAQLEFTQMGLYAPDCGEIPAILVEHDITLDLYEQLQREKPRWETAQQLERWRRFETWAWSEAACVVTMSEKDAASVSGARRVEVIENGVDLARFEPSAEEPEPRRLLFIGSFAHLPNLMALDFFLRESWPLLRERGSTLHVITGARAEHYQELYRDRVQVDLAQPGLEVEGFVSDVRAAYRKAAVVIAPLLASAGTNIKIMEAMAMGKAIVSTPAGINGLTLEEGSDVVVARSGAEMAEAILRLLDHPEERKRIEAQARRTVEERYGWEPIGRKQNALYRELRRR
jgi:GT2 family glycosyltransferase/glycosyltransferase involved in cell wall biosynthesis